MIAHAYFGPVFALVSGVLILAMPELLNYIVAGFLILSGIVGLVVLYSGGTIL